MLNLIRKLIPQNLINSLWHYPLSILANIIYFFPSKKLFIIGVTGTDGKTTTANLIYHILKNAGLKTALVSTISAKIGDTELDTGLHTTSPDKFITQKILRSMVKNKIKYAVLEITAHALDQHRFNGCKFDISILTNVSPEHLDYFKNMDNYIYTKSKLFTQSKLSILNKDDISYPTISKLLRRKKKKFITYGIKEKSDLQAKKIKLTKNSLSFSLNKQIFKSNSNYHYQVYNILSAIALSQQLKINHKILAQTIKNFPPTKGRREELKIKNGIKSIIDYAHTPAALKETLFSLKKINQGNLIVIFGATGGRDKEKRPSMGKVVSKYANIAIITSDDTRHEDINDINKQIREGIPTKTEFIKNNNPNKKEIKEIQRLASKKFLFFDLANRQDAFNLAIKLAQKGDTIIACGKGHEKTILHGKTEYPWSEAEAFRTAFKIKN